MRGRLVVVITSLFLLQSCATIEKKEVEVIDAEKPQVSKALKEAPKRYLKRKVAIARFSNETKYGQSFFRDKDNDPLGKQAMDILSARLASTGKFILLERADIGKIANELYLGKSSVLDVAADYIIVGSISEFGRKTTGNVGIFSRTKKQTAYARVNIRLIDVYTGQIIYSEEGSGEAFSEAGHVMGIGGRAGYDSTLNDKVISAAISKLVNNLIENLLNKPWRSYILSYEDNNFIMAGGKSQGIMVGDIFCVFRRGKKIKNPQTNILIELPGKLMGKIKVNTCLGSNEANEISLCSPVDGDLPIKSFKKFYIQALDAK